MGDEAQDKVNDVTAAGPVPTGEASPAPAPQTTDAVSPVEVQPAKPELTAEEKARREQARIDRMTVFGWLTKLDALFQKGHVLISRDPNNGGWEQTGFFVQRGELCVKFGMQPYQRMGRIDDTYYYPTDVSKIVWVREFALVEPTKTPYAPAFKIEPIKTLISDNDAKAISDKDRERLEEAFVDVGKELERVSAAIAEGELNAIKAAEGQLIDTVKLAAVRCPRLDSKLKSLAMEDERLATYDHRGVINGFDFTKMEPIMIGRAVSEWMRMLLNDDSVRRFIKGTKMSANEGGSELNIVDNILSGLAAMVPGDGQEFNAVEAERQLSNAQATIPAVREAMAPFYDTTDVLGALKATMIALQKYKDSLAPQA